MTISILYSPLMMIAPHQFHLASVDKPHISIKGVADLINQLKSNKGTGPVGISAQLLKLAPVNSAIILKCIFQQCLDSGIVPIDWKHALVTPIHKKDSKLSIGNYTYRPISLTCISCKLLEHILCSHIMKHLSTSNLLSPFQHGFRKFHSCESQLIITIHDLASALNDRGQSDVTWCSWIFPRLLIPSLTSGYLLSWHTMVSGVNCCLGSKVY